MTPEGTALWLRQIQAMLGLELRRTLWGRRAFMLYFLAAIPVLLLSAFNLVRVAAGDLPPEMQATGGVAFFTGLFEFILRGTLYLGCVLLFASLVRGEILDRSLHYYFLAPIRREVFVVGKFVSGWFATTLIFSVSTLLSWFLLHLAFGPGQLLDYVTGIGAAHALGYVAVVALACLGYGAVFLAVGMLLKNPLVPAALIWLWEQANPFLPAAAKKFSIIHYLNSLLPVPPADFAVSFLAEPTPWWLSLLGFLIFSAAILVFSGWRVRSLEIDYGAD